MATKNAQDMTIFEEVVGEPHEDTLHIGHPVSDVVQVRVNYRKGWDRRGWGYELCGQVFQTSEVAVMIFAVFGITGREMILPAKRFSAKKLVEVSQLVKADGRLEAMVTKLKVELARRIVAGESY